MPSWRRYPSRSHSHRNGPVSANAKEVGGLIALLTCVRAGTSHFVTMVILVTRSTSVAIVMVPTRVRTVGWSALIPTQIQIDHLKLSNMLSVVIVTQLYHKIYEPQLRHRQGLQVGYLWNIRTVEAIIMI